jgi:hypothetical protein
MPSPTVRNRVPRVRVGVPDLSKLNGHERAVLGVLYKQPFGYTFAELVGVVPAGKAGLTRALRALADPARCHWLGCSTSAVERTERAAPLAPLYTVTPGWLLTRRAPPAGT